MQMEALNASLVFGAIMSALQQEWQADVEHDNIWKFGSDVIMYDIMLLKIILAVILQYFEVVI